MDTSYLLFKFLHVVAAIVWLGGVFALIIFNARVGRAGDAAAMATMARQSESFGRVAIGPAIGVVLLAGVAMVAQVRISFGSLWILWGLAGIAVSVLISVVAIRQAANQLSELGPDASSDDPRAVSLRGRLATLNVVNLILLVSVVWAMVFKPTL